MASGTILPQTTYTNQPIACQSSASVTTCRMITYLPNLATTLRLFLISKMWNILESAISQKDALFAQISVHVS